MPVPVRKPAATKQGPDERQHYPGGGWRGHPAAGNILGLTESRLASVVGNVTDLAQIDRKIAENPAFAPLGSAHELLPKKIEYNVLVVSANRLLRDLLCDRVAAAGELKLAGSECEAGGKALELIDSVEDEVVLLWVPDYSDPKQLLDQIGMVRARSLRVRLVLIGMPAAEVVFLAAIRAGVSGYVLDDAPMDEVLSAVRLVARGEAACPSQLLPALFRCVAAQPAAPLWPAASNRFGLSRRERQLVPLIAQGLTNKEIASELCLSEQTIKNHLRRMMRKAGAPNRFAVVERCRSGSAAPM